MVKQTLRILTGPPFPAMAAFSGLGSGPLWPGLGTFQDSVLVSPDMTSYIIKAGRTTSYPHHS